MKDVVSQYWNTDTMTAEQAMDRLVTAAKTK
jgi:glucose/mannose transport system substrate-binding protein